MNGSPHKAYVLRPKGARELSGRRVQARHGCLRAPGRKRRGAAELDS